MIRFNQSLLKFTLVLATTLLVVFGIHYGYLVKFQPQVEVSEIALTYLVNFLMGWGVTFALYKLRIKYAHSLGFIFMGGSMLKFIIYFFTLHPIYKADGDVSALEFGFFFIPYGISLAFETLFISQILNETEY